MTKFKYKKGDRVVVRDSIILEKYKFKIVDELEIEKCIELEDGPGYLCRTPGSDMTKGEGWRFPFTEDQIRLATELGKAIYL